MEISEKRILHDPQLFQLLKVFFVNRFSELFIFQITRSLYTPQPDDWFCTVDQGEVKVGFRWWPRCWGGNSWDLGGAWCSLSFCWPCHKNHWISCWLAQSLLIWLVVVGDIFFIWPWVCWCKWLLVEWKTFHSYFTIWPGSFFSFFRDKVII